MPVDVTAYDAPQNILPSPTEEKSSVSHGKESGVRAFESEDGPSFADFLDIINPLQNLPIIGSIYRYLTGDERGGVSAVIGGALFGGPFGRALAALEVAARGESGQDFGEPVLTAMFGGDEKSESGGVMLAENNEPPAPVARDHVAQIAMNGAVQDGEYLVFGGSGSPLSVLNPNRETGPIARPASAPDRRGDFLVFGSIGAEEPDGAVQRLQKTTRAIKADTLFSAVSGATQTAFAPTDEEIPGRTAAALGPRAVRPGKDGDYHGMPGPARTGPARPRQSLPPPTTGAGAVPGGQSEMRVRTANPLLRASTPVSDSDASKWFSSAFNQAMDKYERTRSINGDATNAVATTPIVRPARGADTELH